MTLDEVAGATGGKLLWGTPETMVKGVDIDTRSIKNGDVFIAIKGERVDGHDLLNFARSSGAVAAICEKNVEKIQGLAVIMVENTVEALQRLAAHYRKKFSIPIVAITGSSGKTTTKNLIRSILQTEYFTVSTRGNKNNHIGLPLSILEMDERTEAAVFEMGMSNLGEISVLTKIAKPEIAVITNIGTAHLENLGSKENILKAKMEIFETLARDQTAVINQDDDLLSTIKDVTYKILRVGINSEDLDLKCVSYRMEKTGLVMHLESRDKSISGEFTFRYPGLHNVYNCLEAVAVGKLLGIGNESIQKGLDNYLPDENRMDIISINKSVIINDSYNANPQSMESALDVLGLYKGKNTKLIAVLGDMLEIGDLAEKFHREIGGYAAERGVDLLLTYGASAVYYNEGGELGGIEKASSKHFLSKKDLAAFLKEIVSSTECAVLIKGSRGLKMEEIFEVLKGGMI
ncbi:UDP-N-acetylmuramoyl-tripeptide--D-alanyl-D-alanine ligase [Alkalibacter mobilis]|uniref:UDP-N-acetylmuramoyl-tripeptide--D-alanyl-D- alanine ligase n=1 Tax=Alkalibacter mobilis TaxID=2787712 RepID=UPI00189D9681|nr:UDP-N-acetylmuramoyl-tripeptide--D-alanyl-D-alanine ligase [Alkalibacter mobilis]